MKTAYTLSTISLLTLLAITGCGRSAENNEAPPPPVVTVAKPLVQSFTEYAEYTGRLEAVESVEVRPRVSGYIKSIHFTEGRTVKKGDLLFVIDPRPFETQVNQLKARVQQEKAALVLAEANRKRADQLIKSNAISQEEVDIRTSEALQAEADLAAAEAALNAAELDLSFTQVRAPIDGIADRYRITVGNLVSGGSSNASLLTTIVAHDPIYAYYEVDERTFLRNVRRYFEGTQPGRGDSETVPAEMGLSDEEGFPHKGRIDFASNQLDPNTATMTVRAIFDNPNEFHTPGMFARIRVPVGPEAPGILIPDQAIGMDQTIRFVWVVDEDNTARRVNIETGPIVDGLRVIRSGLQGNENVVVNGILLLRPGVTVNPEQSVIEP